MIDWLLDLDEGDWSALAFFVVAIAVLAYVFKTIRDDDLEP